jgi:hypothetical protein
MVIDVRPVQELKQLVPKLVTLLLLSKVIDVRPVQELKQLVPKLLTVDPITTLTSFSLLS